MSRATGLQCLTILQSMIQVHGAQRASLSLSVRCSGRDAKRAENACARLCPPARTPGRCATELAGARVALLRSPTRSVRASAVVVL